jgi:hypothetical protein
MRFFLCMMLLGFSFQLFSQEDFKQGYIVKNNGDTIQGYLKNDLEEKLSKEVIFKSVNGTEEIFTPGNIQSFGFNNASVFRVVNYTDPLDNNSKKTHFAKILFEGTNNLFSFIKREIYFFVVKVKEDTSFLLYNDVTTASGQVLDKGNYRSQLFYFGRQCENVRSRAEQTQFNEKALLSYFIALEKCLGGATTIYYTKPESEMQFYLFAGGMLLGEKYEITAQGIIRFILPSQSRKTSLNTGFVYLRNLSNDSYQDFFGSIVTYNRLTEIFEVPLTIQYNFLEKTLQPYVYGGIGIAYKRETPVPGSSGSKGLQGSFGLTLIGGVGMEVRFSQKVYAKLDWRYDLLAHYPVIGIVYKVK